ncbi:RCC1 domain-containing protein [Paenibacillus sedimenti]|uniref:Uncharacterized protein n=1 Tax=Paenibacillus sedimenti TaxID=2770274 RepID=A0A926KN94_9BACL|nr:hypothetical protein [Paenibacillus sedimenti]MBD0379896.1 hypothetical protein [Paenibacillus sedimenti]
MILRLWSKRMTLSAATLSAAAVLMLSTGMAPKVLATETSQKVDPKIIQVIDPFFPLALDDQGNVWCMAHHAISVKPGFNSTLMVKAKNLDKVTSIVEKGGMTLALKDDGTVWTVERNTGTAPLDLNDHISAALGDPIPHLEHIVKIDVLGHIGMAIDKNGKVWIFETSPNWVRNSTSLKSEPVLIDGLDHIKDMYISYETTFLKDDGSVWTMDYQKQLTTTDASLYDLIRSTPLVQMKELTDIIRLDDHFALKKDGTVWTWGRSIFAKPNADATDNEVPPFPIAGLSDVVNFDYGGEHALFVKKDGSVWGLGYFIQSWDALGKAPAKVWRDLSQFNGLTDISSVSISTLAYDLTTEAAIKKDGTLWIWGLDQFTNFNSNPLQVEFRKDSK